MGEPEGTKAPGKRTRRSPAEALLEWKDPVFYAEGNLSLESNKEQDDP